MKPISIIVEYRSPKTSIEKTVYGTTRCNISKKKAKIFINFDKNETGHHFTNTWFHEMAHVFFEQYYSNIRLNDKQQEQLAYQIGNVAAGVLSGCIGKKI